MIADLAAAVLTYPQIDPEMFSIGPLSFKWYGMMYVVGIFLGWWYGKRAARACGWRAGLAPSGTQIDDYVFWVALGVILGGRLGYVLFYKFTDYLQDPFAVIKIWEGGMSFHGGLLGVIIVTILFARRTKRDPFVYSDLVAMTVPLGLLFGRLGNFINGELWGKPTDVPWAMVFPGDDSKLPRHPSQLYEAGLEGLGILVVLGLLFWFTNVRNKPGVLTGLFLVLYGASRFAVEYVREPDAHLGTLALGFSMGQWLSLPMILAGLLIALWAARRA